MIGLIGFATDRILDRLGHRLFPWRPNHRAHKLRPLFRLPRPANA